MAVTFLSFKPLFVTVKVSASLSLTALILARNSFKASPVNSTPQEVVVQGALISVARLALVALTSAPISISQAADGEATNVNVCPAIVTVSSAVGCVASDNTAVDVSWLDT